MLGAALAVAGCSQPERLETPETRDERLKLPPDLVSPKSNDAMRIPALAGSSQSAEADDSARSVLPETIGVSMERTGGVRWLTVDAPSQQVYRWAGEYLERLGVDVARRMPEMGVLETQWVYFGRPVTHEVNAPMLQDAEAAEVADRYIMRVERGETSGTTDVFVAHHRIQRDDAGQWQRVQAEPYLEAEFLRGFMLYLGASEAQSLQQVRRSAGTASDAELLQLDSGQTALKLESSMEIGWRRIGQALERAGFTVASRDEEQGEFVVRYDPQASTRESDDDAAGVASYRLVLAPGAGGVVLTVDAVDDQQPEAGSGSVGERILALIREQLG